MNWTKKSKVDEVKLRSDELDEVEDDVMNLKIRSRQYDSCNR